MKYDLREAILWYSVCYQGEWHKIAKAIRDKESYYSLEVNEKYLTIVDDLYPDCFRGLRYPPWIIFYKGNIQLLQEKKIGVIGARNCSWQALENTKIVVSKLKERYCIVSGLAKGIDGIAHKLSLDNRTIGVIGCGIQRVYPVQNKDLFENMYETQLVISEYPGDTKPFPYHFPWRNRLIAALSEAIIVIEATLKSGTMTTVNEALELSKPIYCLPTAFNEKRYEGCNYLISQGAFIISNEKDLEYI